MSKPTIPAPGPPRGRSTTTRLGRSEPRGPGARWHRLALLCLPFLLAAPDSLVGQSAAVAPDVAAEIEAFWAESERTVVEGDFDAYADLYHADAVLVTGSTGTSVPIADALAGWKSLFDDTRDGVMRAHLEIRIARRMAGTTTSHETGIFRYVSHPDGGEPDVGLVHFEALLVKTDDGWKWVMEYQKGEATPAQWEALAR